MSVTSGGTAPNGLRAGGSASGSAGSAGIEMSLRHRRYATSARASGLTAVNTFSGRAIP
jgi:hypothetical protein